MVSHAAPDSRGILEFVILIGPCWRGLTQAPQVEAFDETAAANESARRTILESLDTETCALGDTS